MKVERTLKTTYTLSDLSSNDLAVIRLALIYYTTSRHGGGSLNQSVCKSAQELISLIGKTR